jgi:DNA primase
VKQSDSQKSWLGELAVRYHESLTPETRSYLAGRGLDDEAVDGSLLGLVVEPDPIHTNYEGRLAIPFITPTGTVYMRFRCLEDHDCKEEDKRRREINKNWFHGKYEAPADTGTRLFNVSSLHQADSVVAICEGELDALVATACGLPAVGVPGANNWKPFYYRLFDDFERVIVLGDGDTAGRQFANSLAGNMPNAIPRPMPKGQDITSYVVEYGADAFLQYVGEQVDV